MSVPRRPQRNDLVGRSSKLHRPRRSDLPSRLSKSRRSVRGLPLRSWRLLRRRGGGAQALRRLSRWLQRLPQSVVGATGSLKRSLRRQRERPGLRALLPRSPRRSIGRPRDGVPKSHPQKQDHREHGLWRFHKGKGCRLVFTNSLILLRNWHRLGEKEESKRRGIAAA